MNVKTCLLCGKPLSRLRVGGDGDFCSKEHRSQHRLRAGMDRLEEASKVTSLMRRRESPRQISATRLMCNSAQEPRGFLEAKVHQLKTDISMFAPVLPGPPSPRVVSTDRYAPPRAARLAVTDASRRADASLIQIKGRGFAPVVPPRRQKMQAQIAQAPLAELKCNAPAPRPARRDFGMHRGGEARIYLGKGSLTAGGVEPRRALQLIPRTQPQDIQARALEGKALRVSIGIGFRAPKVKWQDFFDRPASAAGLVWPRTPRPIGPARHDFAAKHRDLDVEIPMRPRRLPVVNGQTRHAQFVFPGGLAPRKRRAAGGGEPAKRTTDVSWRPSEPRSAGMAVVPPSAGFARRNGAHLFTLILTPTSTRPVQQVAITGFVPQEPVGCPKITFEGTVAAAIVGGGEAPGPQAVAPPTPAEMVRIEEHFGGGWEDWVGATKDWRVDVAGVRIGPLALFKPSLELIDYEMEFLARIDTQCVSWVVRAAGLDEYVRCTLTAIPGGELEFSRCTVVGNQAETSVIAAQRTPGKPRSAMTVGTRVSGDTFTVTVDGNSIETWNDDRFPMGGIGFMGAPEDRARLYWVRLASTELTAKEHQKK